MQWSMGYIKYVRKKKEGAEQYTRNAPFWLRMKMIKNTYIYIQTHTHKHIYIIWKKNRRINQREAQVVIYRGKKNKVEETGMDARLF